MQDLKNFRVKKYSGDLVHFDPESLRSSLQKSGANNEEVKHVYTEIADKVYDGISTAELYEYAFSSLKNKRESYAARYSLKKALRELGPEGYYFEKWVGRLFQEDGFESITSQLVKGHAVTHEIDVVVLKDNQLIAIECKFRNDPESRISVTTPMYFMSRVKDIKGIPFRFFDQQHEFSDGLLVTNAYFTSDSIRFSEYHKMNLLSWDYPKNSSIKKRVDSKGEYPITCLTTLTPEDKANLLKHQNCILVKDIIRNPKVLERLNITNVKKKRIMLEANDLVNAVPDYITE